MQTQWTIEARADFTDPGRKKVIDDMMQRFAAEIHGTLAVFVDNAIKPQVIAYSDDFYHGHEEIALHAAKIPAADIMAIISGGPQVSQELLDLAAEARDKAKA